MSIKDWLKSLWSSDAPTERIADTNLVAQTVAELEPRQSRWVEVPEGRIYLRQAKRPGIGETIDIPNIAFDEEARGKGAFTRYLGEIEIEAQRAGLDGVYVENIFNPRLAQFLRGRGYEEEAAAREQHIDIRHPEALRFPHGASIALGAIAFLVVGSKAVTSFF